MSGVLTVAVSVGTPLALLGLVAALAYFAYARQLKHQEKKLDALPPDERAARTDEYLTRYGIDGKKLPVADKLALIKDEMDKRHRRSMTFGIVAAVVFVVCFALSVAAYMVAKAYDGGTATVQDNRPRRLHGPEPVDVLKAAQFLRRNATTFPEMDKEEVIRHFAELPVTTEGKFFCSDPIDTARTNPTVTVKGIPSTNRQCTVQVHVFVPPSHVAPDMKASTSEISDGIATLKLKGEAPEGSVVFAAYWIEGEGILDPGNLEVYMQ